jgi:hypothetical protein
MGKEDATWSSPCCNTIQENNNCIIILIANRITAGINIVSKQQPATTIGLHDTNIDVIIIVTGRK